jgi:hypothetical protein
MHGILVEPTLCIMRSSTVAPRAVDMDVVAGGGEEASGGTRVLRILGPARPRSWIRPFCTPSPQNRARPLPRPLRPPRPRPRRVSAHRRARAHLAPHLCATWVLPWSWVTGGCGGYSDGVSGADARSKLRKKERTRPANSVAGPSNGHGGLATAASCSHTPYARHSGRAGSCANLWIPASSLYVKVP